MATTGYRRCASHPPLREATLSRGRLSSRERATPRSVVLRRFGLLRPDEDGRKSRAVNSLPVGVVGARESSGRAQASGDELGATSIRAETARGGAHEICADAHRDDRPDASWTWRRPAQGPTIDSPNRSTASVAASAMSFGSGCPLRCLGHRARLRACRSTRRPGRGGGLLRSNMRPNASWWGPRLDCRARETTAERGARRRGGVTERHPNTPLRPTRRLARPAGSRAMRAGEWPVGQAIPRWPHRLDSLA